MDAETVAEDALFGVPWRSSHNITLSRFRGQGEGGKPVCHQIDPEQMDRKEGYRQACQRRKEEVHISPEFVVRRYLMNFLILS